MTLILPPEKLDRPVSMTVHRGNIGILFKLQEWGAEGPTDLGEVVIQWDKISSLIDKLTEWKTDNAPKHHHIVVDPAAIGAVVKTIGG